MKTNLRIFKHTFTVLSIMCCLLLGSTTIIYALSDLDSDLIFNSANNTRSSSKINEGVQPSNTTDNTSTISTIDSNTPTTSTSESNTPSTATSDSSASATATSESDTSATSTSSDQVGTTQEQAPPSKVVPPASITISAVGDLMVHQSNLNNAYNPKTGTYDFNGFLEYVKPYLSKSDLTIGNFETITAGSKSGYTSYPSFNTPDAMLTALSNAGFDVLSTANNHCLDRGISGLTRTIQKIKDNKMANVGSSIDGKNKYITKEINGIKVSILSYSSFFNGNDAKLSAKQKINYLSIINENQIKSDIKAVKANGTDATIVILHWGTEYQRMPNTTQTSLSKKILSWGADAILGSHPHVIQKSELVKVNDKNKFVIYSMGNFISGYRRLDKAKRPNKIYTEDGVIVQLQIEKDTKGGVIIKKVDYIPTWVDKNYVNNRPVFKIIPIPSTNITGSYITDYNRNSIKQSYKNTMSIMAKLN